MGLDLSFALGPAPITKGIAKLLAGPQHRLHKELEECPCLGRNRRA